MICGSSFAAPLNRRIRSVRSQDRQPGVWESTFGGAGSTPTERLALLTKQTATVQFIAPHSARHPQRSEFTLHLPASARVLLVFALRVEFDSYNFKENSGPPGQNVPILQRRRKLCIRGVSRTNERCRRIDLGGRAVFLRAIAEVGFGGTAPI